MKRYTPCHNCLHGVPKELIMEHRVPLCIQCINDYTGLLNDYHADTEAHMIVMQLRIADDADFRMRLSKAIREAIDRHSR